jgi:hypothetical protein
MAAQRKLSTAGDERPRGGRPSKYTPEIGEAICDAIAEGESLRAILAHHGVNAATLYRWRASDECVVPGGAKFRDSLALAREASADVLADRALELLLDCPARRDDVAKARELAQQLRWIAACRKPQDYSEKREVVHSGVVDNTLTIRWQRAEEAQPVHTIEGEAVQVPAIPGPLD